MKEIFKYRLRTVSPIHIGCDEVYEPMAFVLNENQRELVSFDPLEFFRELDARERACFIEICKKGSIESILELYKFMRGRRPPGRMVQVCPGLVDHYQKTLGIPTKDSKRIQQELNNFTIARTAFNTNSNQPYVPGSAIKGAIRTAYLNRQAAAKRVARQKGSGATKQLEKMLLDGGDFQTDPFRLLKVSDFVPVGEARTRIVYAVNEKKVPSRFEARGPYQILEVIEPECVFEGWITIGKPETNAGIKTPLIPHSLFDSIVSFYSKEKSREDRELLQIGIEPVQSDISTSGFMLRVGRHSGAESVTIEGHRRIKIMMGRGQKPRNLDHATTFWLASDSSKPADKKYLRPFGWAVLEGDGRTSQQVPAQRRRFASNATTKTGSVDLSGLKKKYRIRKQKS